VATYLMNEKREMLADIERRGRIDIILVPNRYLETPAYEIRRVRDDEAGLPENSMISHQMAVEPKIDLDAIATGEEEKAPVLQQPAVTTIIPSTPAPPAAPEVVVAAPVAVAAAPVVAAPAYGPRDNVLVRLWRWLAGDKRAPEPASEPARGAGRKEGERSFDRPRRDRDERGRGGRGDRDRDSRRDGRGDRDGRDGREGRRDGRGSRDEARRDDSARGQRDAGPRGGERRDEPPGRPPQSPQAPRRDEGPRGNRDGGGQRGERRDGPPQGQRGPQQQQSQRPQREPREPREARESREPRLPRSDAPEVREQVAASSAVIAAVAGDMAAGDAALTNDPSTAVIEGQSAPRQDRPDGERGERGGRRSRRGGRRRRGRGDGSGAAAGAVALGVEGGADDDASDDGGDRGGDEAPREFTPARMDVSPAPAHEAPRVPEPRSFDFERPSVAPVVVEPPVSREPPPPAPSIATAVEPREWTPTPPTDAATPRNEP
jgi:ribonuclease E